MSGTVTANTANWTANSAVSEATSIGWRASERAEPPEGPGASPREGVIERHPVTRATAVTGTTSTNSHRQLATSSTSPASSGPSTSSEVPPVASAPIAQPRLASPTARVVLLSASGCTNAPPMPCTNRAAMSSSTVGAAAQSIEPSANSARPPRNVRLRPRRSASRPATTMNSASAAR